MAGLKRTQQKIDKNNNPTKTEPIGSGIFKAVISPCYLEDDDFEATEYQSESLTPEKFSVIGRSTKLNEFKFISIVLPRYIPNGTHRIVKPQVEGVHAALIFSMVSKNAKSGTLTINRTEDNVDVRFEFIFDNEGTTHTVVGRVYVKPTGPG